ncbi:MAG TPA: acetylxylan esterase [Armatimonadota bacterium]|jgi:cephalosporin-C deacetylase
MLIRLFALAALLPLIAATVAATPSRPFAAVPFSAGRWWEKAPSVPLTLADGSTLGSLSIAWDAESVYAHLTGAAQEGTLSLQFTGATRKMALKDGVVDFTRTWKSLGLPPGERNALVPLNIGFARKGGPETWIPKDPLGLNTLTWGVVVLDSSAAPTDCAPTLTRPFRFRFDPTGGHPALIFEPEPIAGLCLPVDVTFTSVGASDTIVRHLRTAGGPARFEVEALPGNRAGSVTLRPVGYSDPGSVAEYRSLAVGTKLETYRGAPGWEEPKDWAAHWEKAREELAAVPANPRITEVEGRATRTGKLYKVVLDSIDGVSFACWYFVPKDVDVLGGKSPRRYPAIQVMPGYGAEEPPLDRTADGFIVLSVNPRGHGPSNAFWKLPDDHLSWNITEPDKYYYRGAYMDCLRAIQWLMTRPEVNAQSVGVEGSSQGGAFALATAAMEPRVAVCSANVPFLCDWPDSVRLTTRGGFSGLRSRFESQTEEGAAIRKTIGYIDAAFMAGHIKCPTLISAGEMDRTCPPQGGAAAYNRLPKGTQKQLLIVPLRDHEVMPEWRAATSKWYARWLKKPVEALTTP